MNSIWNTWKTGIPIMIINKVIMINKTEKIKITKVVNEVLKSIKNRCKKQGLDKVMTNAAFYSVQDFLTNLDTDSGKCK